MNTTGKTITAITTAAAIGTGVLLTTTQEPAPVEQEQPVAQVEFVDDIKPIEVPVFSVDIPAIDVPAIDVPDIENLSPEQTEVLAMIASVVDVAGYSIETISAAIQAVDGVGVENLSPVQIRIILQEISRVDGDVPKIQALQKVLVGIMKDQRALQYDQTLMPGNEAITAWLEIYSRPLPPPIAYIPLPRGIRMIAELRSSDHAAVNLAFYRAQGYNACLVTIDGTENSSKVLQLVNLVRGSGMAAWIAWAGPENLEWSIYQDPAKISRLLKAAAPLCQGYLVAWRRTSAHLFAQDAPYLEYLVQQVRQANPAIYVAGESYYGETWENKPFVQRKGWEARDNVPRNQSGILIAGIATQGFAIEAMLRRTFSRWVATPRLGMVLGERAYYASTNNTGRSFLSALRIKQQLEKRFLRAGCIGTITIHGDGSDRGSTIQTVDDLGKYRID